jgi:TRAP-type C4-dicarboxylate transport system permease small subunit
VQKVPVTWQRWLELLAYLSTLSFAVVVMIWGGYLNASLAWDQQNPVLPVNAGALYLAVPVAGVLFSFYLLYHVVRTLSPSYSGAEQIAPEDEVEL